MISIPEFSHIWQQSIDVLEYQSPAIFQRHIVGGRWRSAIRYVLMGGFISALIVTVDALINGADPLRSFIFSVLSVPVDFSLFTLGVFWVLRLFRQRVRLRDLTYGFALFFVPLSILMEVGQAFASLLPTVLGGLATAVIVLFILWLEVRLAYTAVRALSEFRRPWQLWLALVIGAGLGGVLTGVNAFDIKVDFGG